MSEDYDELDDRRKSWGSTTDIFECGACGRQGHAVAPFVTEWVQDGHFGSGTYSKRGLDVDKLECEECGSLDVYLFVKRPAKIPADKEEAVIEADPNWKDHFHDIDVAYDFYFRS